MYGWARVPAKQGISPSAVVILIDIGGGSKYCSLRSQHHEPHRTDGL